MSLDEKLSLYKLQKEEEERLRIERVQREQKVKDDFDTDAKKAFKAVIEPALKKVKAIFEKHGYATFDTQTVLKFSNEGYTATLTVQAADYKMMQADFVQANFHQKINARFLYSNDAGSKNYTFKPREVSADKIENLFWENFEALMEKR